MTARPLPFGTRGWLRAYEKAAAELLCKDEGLSCSLGVAVQGEAGAGGSSSRTLCLGFEEGLLASASYGLRSWCDIAISIPVSALACVFATRSIAPAEAEEVRISYPEQGATAAPMPPFDEPGEAAFGRLPRIEGASAKVRLDLTGSPIGSFSYFTSFVDGRRKSCGAEASWAPEVVIEMRFVDFLALRAGSLPLLEVFDHGRIGGRLAQMTVVGGIVESAAYRAAWQACPRGNGSLSALSSVMAPERFGALREWAAGATSFPGSTR